VNARDRVLALGFELPGPPVTVDDDVITVTRPGIYEAKVHVRYDERIPAGQALLVDHNHPLARGSA
jgi:hypothetical protein